jgi:hypothetical protein
MIFVENLDEKPALVRLECVKKQLTLTGFPLTIFATAKRRMHEWGQSLEVSIFISC